MIVWKWWLLIKYGFVFLWWGLGFILLLGVLGLIVVLIEFDVLWFLKLSSNFWEFFG